MKRIAMLSLIASGYFLHAQSQGNSPYAAYGIGEIKYDNTVDIAAMGRISTAYVNDFNNKFNFANPAANLNFALTSISIEGANDNTIYSSNFDDTKSTTRHVTRLSNLSIVFPLSKKLKFGLGYQPYSSKSYNIIKKQLIADEVSQLNRFKGDGSVSLLQGALGYNVNKNFSLGLRVNYFFGNPTDLEELSYTNAELINGYETKFKVKSLNLTAGAVFQTKLINERNLTLGATYTFGGFGKTKTTFTNATYYYINQDDKANENIIQRVEAQTNNLIPQEASFGVGYGDEARWFASTQFNFKKGEETLFLGKPFLFDNTYRVSAGGWYLPNYNNFRNYFSRIMYRFGAYYERGGLSLDIMNSGEPKNINQYALTVGATFPFATTNINRFNGIDFAFEIGKMGTKQNNLVGQTFFNIKIGLNFADLWFRKAEFD